MMCPFYRGIRFTFNRRSHEQIPRRGHGCRRMRANGLQGAETFLTRDVRSFATLGSSHEIVHGDDSDESLVLIDHRKTVSHIVVAAVARSVSALQDFTSDVKRSLTFMVHTPQHLNCLVGLVANEKTGATSVFGWCPDRLSLEVFPALLCCCADQGTSMTIPPCVPCVGTS